jgi:hypothetical protein
MVPSIDIKADWLIFNFGLTIAELDARVGGMDTHRPSHFDNANFPIGVIEWLAT